jgi:hypothetical protein
MIERDSAGQRTIDERFGRSLQLQQRDRISRRRRTWQQMVVKRQTVWPNCVSKVIGGVTATQQINEFSIVCGSEDDVRPHVSGINKQLGQYRFAGGDTLDGVCATKQFIEQEQMRSAVATRSHQPQKCFDLDEDRLP